MTATRTIDIDLRRDLVGIYRDELIRLGYEVCSLDDDTELIRAYFGVCRRLVLPKPRRVLKSINFKCPAKHREALSRIERIVHDGGDLTPYLSTKIKSLDYNDGLLNDWGIHHLHLGERTEPNGFVTRTGPLLYCRFEGKLAYFIAVLRHGSWAKQVLVNTIHENWPDLIDRYRARGVIGVSGDRLSDEDIATLRTANVGYLLELDDGTIYLPIGGGTVSSGENVRDIIQADKRLKWAEQMQQRIVERFTEIEKRARDRDIVFDDPAVFELRFIEEMFCAVEVSSNYVLTLGDP